MASPEAHSKPTVVVGVDGSDPSIEALQWAARQARLIGARLRVATAWEYPTSYGWVPAYPPGFDPAAEAHKLLDSTLEQALGAGYDLEVERVVLEGHPAPILVDAAKGANLLVVGTRGHGGFAGLLLGSVGEHCVTHAPCPVVVVRGEVKIP